jgi:hypothetical protein
VITELSALEKALGKNDFESQRAPLESLIKLLRPLKLKSVEGLELNARGRLITTLLRVSRQTKPAVEAPAAAESAPSEAPAAEAASAEASDAEAGSTETAESQASEESAAPTEAVESAPAAVEPVAAAPEKSAAPAAVSPAERYADVLERVGRVWRSIGESDRAATAFEASGRTPAPEPEAPPAPAAEARRPGRPNEKGGERGSPRGARPERGARKEAGRRPEVSRRPEGPRRSEPLPVIAPGEDWRPHAAKLEEQGRTRDAARLHERYQSHSDAARLFEAGGDLRNALKNALAANQPDQTRLLLTKIPPAEVQKELEKAGAYELLMELHVKAGRFEDVAKLYERARQFDQAGLAWERTKKYGLARKAYEKARDVPSAERMRGLETQQLIERGDRLGAAQLMAQRGRRVEAAELLSSLPAPKAYRFLQKIQLDAEAKALAERELAKADSEGKPQAKARWLELTGEFAAAADVWEKADRRDKALPLYEKVGDLPKAGALAEALGLKAKAVAVYEKLGDTAALERARQLPDAPPPAAPTSESSSPEDASDTVGEGTPEAE